MNFSAFFAARTEYETATMVEDERGRRR